MKVLDIVKSVANVILVYVEMKLARESSELTFSCTQNINRNLDLTKTLHYLLIWLQTKTRYEDNEHSNFKTVAAQQKGWLLRSTVI